MLDISALIKDLVNSKTAQPGARRFKFRNNYSQKRVAFLNRVEVRRKANKQARKARRNNR